MLEIMIPRDIRDFETKFIGPLTFRQTICFAICAAIGYIGYYIQLHILMLSSANYAVLIPFAAIPLAFAYGKELVGMHFEVYIQMVFVSMFLTPKHRPYKTHSYYKTLEPKKGIEKNKKDKLPKDLPKELQAYN